MSTITKGVELVGRVIEGGRLELKSILGVGAYGVVYLARDWASACACPPQCPCRPSSFSVTSGIDDDPSSAGGGPSNHNTRYHQPHHFQACPCDAAGGIAHYVAVKCLAREGLNARQRLFQRREIVLHSLASNHPNVAAVHRVFDEGVYTFIVMDYLPGGDLFAMIADRGRYLGDDELIRSVFLQIIDAIAYCHAMGIYHRDLKPENILCSADGTKVALADFGLATTETVSTDFGCGSSFYLSPECQGGLFAPLDSYSTVQADLWSLGVILVNLACVRNPWKHASLEDDTFRAYIEDPSILSQILPLSSYTTLICAGLFARNPADRISLAQLRAMVVAAPTFSAAPPPPPPAPTPTLKSIPSPIPVRSHPYHKPKAIPHYQKKWQGQGLVPPPPRAHTPLSVAPSSHASSVLVHSPASVSNMSSGIMPSCGSNMSVIMPGVPPPSVYAHLAPYAPHLAYVAAPSTPASTPGLVGSDPFGIGRPPSPASSSGGSLPPTPGLSPIPLPHTNDPKHLGHTHMLEASDIIPPLQYI